MSGGDRSEQEVTLLEEGRRPGARGLHERGWYPAGRRLDDDRQRQGRRAQWSSRPRGRYLRGTARHCRDATAAPCRGERRRPGTVPAAAHRAQLGRHDRRVRVGSLHAYQESQRKKRAGGSGQRHQRTHTRWTRDRQPTGAGLAIYPNPRGNGAPTALAIRPLPPRCARASAVSVRSRWHSPWATLPQRCPHLHRHLSLTTSCRSASSNAWSSTRSGSARSASECPVASQQEAQRQLRESGPKSRRSCSPPTKAEGRTGTADTFGRTARPALPGPADPLPSSRPGRRRAPAPRRGLPTSSGRRSPSAGSG